MVCLVGAVMGPYKVQGCCVRIRAVGHGCTACPLHKGARLGGKLGAQGPQTSSVLFAMILVALAQRKGCLSVIPHLGGASFSIRTKVKNMVALGLIIMETFLSNLTTSSEGREKRK